MYERISEITLGRWLGPRGFASGVRHKMNDTMTIKYTPQYTRYIVADMMCVDENAKFLWFRQHFLNVQTRL